MEENFYIIETELKAFKKACKKTIGVEFIKYENEKAFIRYTYNLSLFYLGIIFQLQLNE